MSKISLASIFVLLSHSAFAITFTCEDLLKMRSQVRHLISYYELEVSLHPSVRALQQKWQKETPVTTPAWLGQPIAVLEEVLQMAPLPANFQAKAGDRIGSDAIVVRQRLSKMMPNRALVASEPIFAQDKFMTQNNLLSQLVLEGPDSSRVNAENKAELMRAEQKVPFVRKDEISITQNGEQWGYIRFIDGSPFVRLRSGNNVFHALVYDGMGAMIWEHVFRERNLDMSFIEKLKADNPYDRFIEISRLFARKSGTPAERAYIRNTWEHKILDRTYAEENDLQQFSYGPSKRKPRIFYYANTDAIMAQHLRSHYGFKLLKAAIPKDGKWIYTEIPPATPLPLEGDYVLQASAPELLKALQGRLAPLYEKNSYTAADLAEQVRYIDVFLKHNAY
jgi:hypothetical protein